ncbi:ankyrin repeat domain-containing protein 61 [Pelodiscus sinensis]|nr:ankyrin repeat domain-containing protein 61 [Pelodiscus sinensis]|eukprot:XP_006112874.1 ankyrin repeat domain-containing protein 61 [Pelodiscus sinensis]
MGNITKGAITPTPDSNPFIYSLSSSRQKGFKPLQAKLYEAIMKNDSTNIKALLAHQPVNEPMTVWDNAARRRPLSIQDQSILPIHLAAKYRREKSLCCLLESGADPKIRDNRGYTALQLLLLHWPKMYITGTDILTRPQKNLATTQRNAEECLRILCEKGVQTDPEMDRDYKHSSLHLALYSGASQAISILIENGANIDDRNEFGKTALHIAAEHLNKEITETLITYGANINCTLPTSGKTALQLAVCTASSKAGRVLAADIDCIRLLLMNGAEVNAQDCEGRAAIHNACLGGRKEIVELLLDYHADANTLTRHGQSPLFLFLQNRSNLRCTSLLNKLLSFSYPLKLTNNRGDLPTGLLFPEFQMQKDFLIRLSQIIWSLQDICKVTVRRIYGEKNKQCLKKQLPVTVWNSLYNYQDYSQL